MNEFNILLTSAGRRVSLLRLFKQTLAELQLRGQVVTSDLQPTAPARFVADAHEQVPRVDDPRYLDRLKEICLKHRIRLVVPLIDTELPRLALHRDAFRELGVTLLVSSPEVARIAHDKRCTNEFFRHARIPTPRLLDADAMLQDPEAAYPVLVKPTDGSASVGVTKICNRDELAYHVAHVQNAIVQEFVVGDEYTLDILADFAGRVRCVVPRLRIETRAGEVSKGMTVKHPAIIAAGRRVVEALPGAVGPITAQCFLTRAGETAFIEINPRFGGGFPLSAAAGANFPRWIIEWVLGREPEIDFDGWQDGIVMLRYDDAIFVTKEAIE